MGLVISDGLGKGRDVGVDLRNRILASSVSLTESNFSTLSGLKYNINTGDITITNSATLTVLYLKNNDDRDLIVDALIYNLGTSTGGSGDVLIDVRRNPVTGGIITNANPVDVGNEDDSGNLNFGSSNTLVADVYKGTQGETVVSGGGPLILTRRTSVGSIFISPGGGFLIPKGTSVAINYTPQTGNTNQICQFALNAYIRDNV